MDNLVLWYIDCVGVSQNVNPCGSFCVVSQRKGEKEIEETVDEMKERDREERGTRMKVKKQGKNNSSPLPLPATRIVGLAQL